MYYKIAQLMLAAKQRAGAVSEIFIAQPDANKESLVGKLFILAELEINKTDGLKLVNFLIDNLNQNYYQNEKVILREKISALKIDHIFESALALTNKSFAKFLETERIALNPELLNILVGVIYKNNLYISNLGKNKALLLYQTFSPKTVSPYPKQQQAQTQPVYKIADIAKRSDEESGEINTEKLFTNVISGQIPPNGYLLLSNETLPEYLSNKQIIDIITTLPPAGAVEQIKHTLSAINAYVSFLGIIIKNTFGEETAELKKIPIMDSTSKISVEKFNTTEEKTEELLSPSGIVNFSKWLNLLSFLKKKTPSNAMLVLKDKIVAKRRSNFALLKKIWTFLLNIFFIITKSIGRLFSIFSSQKKTAGLFKNVKLETAEKCAASARWFKSLSYKSKFALIVFVACILFLAHNIAAMNTKNKKTADEKIYNDLVDSIQRKQSQIEANLLYNNEGGAKELLAELQRQISQLPQNSQEQKNFYAQIIEKFNRQSENVLHVSKAAAKQLADFKNLHDAADPENIVLIGNIIYSADSKQKAIYNLDLKDNLATEINDLKQDASNLLYPASENNNLYYFTGNGILKLDTKAVEISALTVDISDSRIAAMSCYGGRLYYIDKQANQIEKANIGKNALGTVRPWLKDRVQLSDAVGMSIDGSLYILKSSGIVEKYLKGAKLNFQLQKIDPVLNHADKIETSAEMKYIYILDRSANRLAVFDKNGIYKAQYQPDKLDDIKSFAVDETAKKIYFLNGTSVYSVDASHL